MSGTVTDLKAKGDDAFRKGDYATALSMYSAAIHIDHSNQLCYLNRSMVNLKLERWCDAESDATEAIQLGYTGVKALYRRAVARREQGDFSKALEDISSYLESGGDSVIAKNQLAKIPGFKIASAAGRGLGAFAVKPFKRGDLILSEPPLFSVRKQDGGGRLDQAATISAISVLSQHEREQFLSLENSRSNTGPFINPMLGIYQTNAFAMEDERDGIFLETSRFNHSCSPNARYSFNPAVERMRIYALRDIAIGDEILVSYLSGRNVYGSTHQERQAQLERFGFVCTCATCSLQGAAAKTSDARRTEIARIWASVPHFTPSRTRDRLSAIARAINLLQEEGYAADHDDFTNDAATICAYHSDWASARYWATMTYETRVAEFGEDSFRAEEIRPMYLNAKSYPMAGQGLPQNLTIRL